MTPLMMTDGPREKFALKLESGTTIRFARNGYTQRRRTDHQIKRTIARREPHENDEGLR